MAKDYIQLDKIRVSKHAINNMLIEKLSDYDTFEIENKDIVKIEGNSINIDLELVFTTDLKTYKAIVDIVEKDIYESVFFFTTVKPNTTIKISKGLN